MADPSEQQTLPVCRDGVSAADLAREAERSVLYAAILLTQRPATRIKPAIAAAAQALVPAVQAFLNGQDDLLAEQALAYARACDAEAFLRAKRDQRTHSASRPGA